MCQVEAPEYFTVLKRGWVKVHNSAPPDSARESLARAVDMCPTRALSLHDRDA